jgi:hypothetical protein
MKARWSIAEGDEMIAELKKTAEAKMQKSLEALRNDLQKVRTGRAHTGLLDHVQVDYYGSMVPVNQVANITWLMPGPSVFSRGKSPCCKRLKKPFVIPTWA